MNRIFAAMLLALLTVSTFAQSGENSAKEAEVKKTMNMFIQAFTNLDWEPFRAALADDATVFYPRAIARRADGRAEFERNFHQVFAQIRNGRMKGPYLEVQPRELRIQLAGDVAIVTFHLDDKPGFVNRRTVVLQKRAGNWKIIHLHASEVAVPGSARFV